MFSAGSLTDVTLSASGTSVKAHRIVLASCSQYFAQLFKEIESDSTLVIVLGCEPTELRLLLTFMYTGEVTASKKNLPPLLRLAQTLKVYGLTDADRNVPGTAEPKEEDNSNTPSNFEDNFNSENVPLIETSKKETNASNDSEPSFTNSFNEFLKKNDNEKLSRLDQIVQNLYSSHKTGKPEDSVSPVPPNFSSIPAAEERSSGGCVCTVCGKRLSNQYNLRVHLHTHAPAPHACSACRHVSRSRDALRKHVAYRHARRH